MQVTRILHTSVNVQGQLGECDRFYGQVLGIESTARPHVPGVEGSWFELAGCQVHLVDALHAPDGIDPTGPHVCFGVRDLDAAKAELEARGIPFVRATQDLPDGPDGPRRSGEIEQVWFVDPAGNTIEIQADPDGVVDRA
jgi:catechol 2,3-dioxygenase-like lactoylglutathione lyase family enzyme